MSKVDRFRLLNDIFISYCEGLNENEPPSTVKQHLFASYELTKKEKAYLNSLFMFELEWRINQSF